MINLQAMNPLPKFLSLGFALLSLAASALSAAPIRVLYFTKSAGYEHSVIKQVDGKPSYSEVVLSKLAPGHQLEFTYSKDGSKFSPQYLSAFDVVIFYTSGDLLTEGTDKQPAMTQEGKQALLDWVASGKGFMALHAGSDSFHTGEHGGGNNPNRAQRFKNYGDASDPYVKMLGGEFIKHGPQQVASARVIDPAFPGFGQLGSEVKVQEEWYSLKEFAADDHVLLVMETKGMEGSDYDRPPYPLAWARLHGKGRVAYNAMGHREDVWDSTAYQSMLVGMIQWAAGTVKADVTPNLAKVTPGHATLPKVPVEKPAADQKK
ncbi:MAG: ThuA domain-containing protein [Opitutus sp.]